MNASFIVALRIGMVLGVALLLTHVDAKQDRKNDKRKEAPASELQLVVELRDGSRLVGIPSVHSVPLQTSFAKIDLPLKIVDTIEFADDRERVKVSCSNGDLLQGVLNLSALQLTTSFGKVSVVLKDIVRISSQPAEVSRGRVLYYSFDQDEDSRVSDRSGHENDGRVRGARWTSKGKLGGALTFNGASDYVSRRFDESCGLFPTDSPFSVAAWFNTSSTSPIEQTIVATHYAGFGIDGYFLCVDTRDYDGRAMWFVGGQEAVVTSKSPVNDGQWHHAVGVWDGRRSYLYIDGNLQGVRTTERSLVYDHRAPFRVGHMDCNGAPHAQSGFYHFTGMIDEVMVFDRCLSDVEVKQIYRLRKPDDATKGPTTKEP